MADAWEGFDYEIEMYFETQNLLGMPSIQGTVRNALAESFLLHTRVLVEFLLDRGSKPDDVRLRTLAPEADESEKLREVRTKLKRAYGTSNQTNTVCWTLNKRLAHLTKVRNDRYDYGAQLNKVGPHIHAMLTELAHMTRRPILLHYLT